MKRFATTYLESWYKNKNSMPLIIRGARQVGKSTLVRIFCQEQKIDLIELNFEIETLKTIDNDDFKLLDLINEIELKKGKPITSNTLLFFDEIQEVPRLIKLLRYFYEERPEMRIIAAGSLLEIALKSENFSFPVGRVAFYHLGPMTFSEFLMATKRDLLLEKLSQGKFSSALHTESLKALREYFYVGGMPQAVKEFSQTGRLFDIRNIQNQIIQTYQMDFPKYNRRIDVGRIARIFSAAALNTGKKVIYSKIDQESSSRETKRVLEILFDARVLIPCFHSEGNSSPLAGEADLSLFKTYFIDIGLLLSLLNLNLDQINAEFDSEFNVKGFLAEQFIAQHLYFTHGESRSPQIYYHLRDKGSQKAEIDFMYEKNAKIYPLEVKASAKGHLKSLAYFSNKKNTTMAFKTSIASFDIIQNAFGTCPLTNIPLYAIEYIDQMIE